MVYPFGNWSSFRAFSRIYSHIVTLCQFYGFVYCSLNGWFACRFFFYYFRDRWMVYVFIERVCWFQIVNHLKALYAREDSLWYASFYLKGWESVFLFARFVGVPVRTTRTISRGHPKYLMIPFSALRCGGLYGQTLWYNQGRLSWPLFLNYPRLCTNCLASVPTYGYAKRLFRRRTEDCRFYP